jgi:hypothetical protein
MIGKWKQFDSEKQIPVEWDCLPAIILFVASLLFGVPAICQSQPELLYFDDPV